MERVEELEEASREVFESVSLENGAIVAGNTDKDYYPGNVQNYRFVWPRDNAFILEASDALGLSIRKDYLDWMVERMEHFSSSGVIYHRYLTNGPRDPQFGHQFQPDQAGATLWALRDASTEKEEKVVELAADGLVSSWNGTSFKSKTHDLWEERSAFSEHGENFTYTLAACMTGLKEAYRVLGKETYYETAEEMSYVMEDVDYDYFPKSTGIYNDETVDASSLGLVWPFNNGFDRDRLEATVEEVEEKLLEDVGMKRYPYDMYDSMLESSDLLMKGAGGWPVLTFWYHIVLDEIGREDEARRKFEQYLEKVDGTHLPEQVFEEENKNSVRPLAWSHAMFVIAAEKLGYL